MLKDSISIGNLTLKNRLVMPPMATYKADADGKATPELCAHYDEKSAGGCLGLVIVEHSCINAVGKAGPRQLSAASDSDIPGLRRLSSVLHGNGVPVFAQINHAGGAAVPDDPNMQTLSAGGAVPPNRRIDRLPQEMTQDQIRETAGDFAAAAVRIRRAGFDGVEIHAAHGYLLSQFLSPLTNRRPDPYGETRWRLHLEVIEAVRAAVGEDFPVAVRLGACDYMDGGVTPEDGVRAAAACAEAGADLLDISGGFCGYHRPGAAGQGYFSDLTAAIRQAVDIPVLLTGGIADADAADRLLCEGAADLIGVGRAILKDSAWAVRAMEKCS